MKNRLEQQALNYASKCYCSLEMVYQFMYETACSKKQYEKASLILELQNEIEYY